MIKSFEPIYKETEDLFINKLPEYIDKINKKYNDGLMLQSFTNTNLEEKCINRPSFIFDLKQTEHTEKDRIIENTIYNIEIKIQLPERCKGGSVATFWRYVEAIATMFNEHDSEINYEISDAFDNILQITIFNE